MNREKFKHIARSSKMPDTTDIVDLVEITKEFPYFSWGFALLAKIYSEREDFRTETLMHQAALRVSNREWLYNYIHGNSEVNDHLAPQDSGPTNNNLEATNNTELTEIQKSELQNSLPQTEVRLVELSDPLNSEFPTVTIEEKDSVVEVLAEAETEAITEVVSKVESEVESKSTPTLEELKSAFLKSELETIPEEEIQPLEFKQNKFETESFNQEEKILQEETPPEVAEQEKIPQVEIHHAEIQTPVIDQTDIQNNEITIESIEESESSLFFPVIETTDLKETNSTDYVFTPSTFQPETTSPETKKSKGYYNIEDYYTLPPEAYNQYQFKASSKENEPKTNTHKNSTNDFYSWLNSDIPQNAPAVKPVERREDLLDKFLKNKPLPSRPKQEFYSPEKAGKRSDKLSKQIVTETLANIYYKQGNFSKAIEAYQQLQLKFPEKLSYFANLIEKIKKESIS